MSKTDEIHIFTDGSTLNNQSKWKRKGGIGVFFGDDDNRNISTPLIESSKIKVTNQVAELLACVKGIETLYTSQKVIQKSVILYTDSMYIVNIINNWGKNWEKNNWKKSDGKQVDNLNLVKKVYYYSLNLGVSFKHVKSHQKEPDINDTNYFIWYGNSKADELATNAAKSI